MADELKFRDFAAPLLRALILVIIPFMLGLYVLPHTQYLIGKAIASPEIAKSSPLESVKYSFENSGADSLPQAIGAVFPLANYLGFPPLAKQGGLELCFEDRGTYFSLPNGSSKKADVRWAIVLNKQTSVVVPQNTPVCLKANSAGQNTYEWTVMLDQAGADYWSATNASLVPTTNAYPRAIIDYGLLQGIVMIPAFFLFVWYPAAGIIRKIRNGMMDQ